MGNRSNTGAFAPMIAGLAGVAWAALFWLHSVPAGHHHAHGRDAASLLVLGGQGIDSRFEWATLFLAGWLLMTAAMMLPTILPLLNLFRKMTAEVDGQARMLTLLLSGYLGVWFVFGLVLSVIGITGSRWVPSFLSPGTGRMLGPILFLVAGVFQFLPAKRRCLERCHSPVDSDFKCWSDCRPLRSSFVTGMHHGLSCVGCCWAMMLLMFAAGSAHLAWMIVLTAAIVVEKNLPWGRQLARPMGVVLLSCAAVLFLYQ